MRMNKHSRLHLPRAPARPGEVPDFSYVQLSPAGAVARPDVNARARDIESPCRWTWCGCSMMPGTPWGPGIRISMPRNCKWGCATCCSRALFDDRMQRNQRAGKISFYIRSLGEEAVSVAQCMALRPGDMLFPSYRNQGLQIVRGIALVDLMCQLLSNTRDMCKGRQLPVMYHSKASNIFSISGNLATQFPQAVGWAMAAAIKGEDHLAAELDRRGQQRRGRFPSCLLFASVYQAPVILNVVNNQWAISTFPGICGRRATLVRGARPGVWHRGHSRRRQRLPRGLCRDAVGGRTGAHRGRTHVR